MINAVYFILEHADGSKRRIIIEPILEKGAGGIISTGTYKIYKNSADNQSGLFTEKLEIDERNDDLPDESNPDFLGSVSLKADGKWLYEGDLLNVEEQKQVVNYIQKHQ
ncbi:MAG TPA: hypothetical protein VL442_10380 [Mucilaginibacter sp.]|jgi:hypothetical protein|nr:hypothetical protein [Mucilaginibacter sp.]